MVSLPKLKDFAPGLQAVQSRHLLVLAQGENLGLCQRGPLPFRPLARAVLEARSEVGLEEGRVDSVVLLVGLQGASQIINPK